MAARETETYADWLARMIEERHLSVHKLARAWNPIAPEIARRSLRRYLNGKFVPNSRTRQELARALGTSESGPRQSDDKEGDLHAPGAHAAA